MKFWTHSDPRGCGIQVRIAAEQRGHKHIASPRHGTPDVAYIRTINYGLHKKISLEALKLIASKEVPHIPGVGAYALYDNKLNQYRAENLYPWIPRTYCLYSLQEAYKIAEFIPLPVVSKASHGSGSQCVRLIEDRASLVKEARKVFGDGIKLGHAVQKDYVIWQRFIPGNSGDVRVVVAGSRMYGLFRRNRPDVPFASGSGDTNPITNLHGIHTYAAFSLAREIAKKMGFPWSCYDIVFDGDKPLCLEMSFSWTEQSYNHCPTFTTKDFALSKTMACDWPEFAVDLMEEMYERSPKKIP